MEFDQAFAGGCCVFEGERWGELHVRPFTPPAVSGTQHFEFLGRLTGARGPQRVCLHWPPTDLSAVREYTNTLQFATVLDRAIFTSRDLERWERVGDVRVEGLCARFTVEADGAPLYVAVGKPYLENNLTALFAVATADPRATVVEIGRSRLGRPLRAIRIGGEAGGGEGFYLQALQHRTEWAGGRIIDTTVRYLLSDEGQPYRDRYTWHFVPVVNVDGALGGWPENHPKNMNRDWAEFEMPETRAVRDYIDGLYAAGERLLHAIDFHMGWSRRDSSGAGIMAFRPGTVPEEASARQERIARHIFAHTTYTEAYMPSGDPANRPVFPAYTWNAHRLPGQTFECSRHLYPAGPGGAEVPAEQCHEEALGRDLLRALCTYDWSNEGE
jgi:hypothetical protein